MDYSKDRAISGFKWSGVVQAGRQVTQLLTIVILARLISPSDFGVLGMAVIVTGFIGVFKDLGTSAAVVQQKQLNDNILSSIFWVNVAFGIAAMLFLILFAPFSGVFYQEVRVVPVLRVLSIGFFVSGLGILYQALLERSLSFSTLAKLEIISILLGAIVAIVLAFANAGVWSLVFQSLTSTSIATILLWHSSAWRPKLVFHWNDFKAVSSFSLNLTGFNIFNYFARNADYLLIGRFLGVQDLGYYTLAYRILLFPIENISAVIGRVLYPVLASLQEDNNRFASTYLKIVKNIALITFPLMMGIVALASPFIMTVFGVKWRPVIPLVIIFAPVGMIQSIGTTVGAIYQAKGRTDWLFRWGIGSGLLIVLALWIGIQWGILGVATAYTLVSFLVIYFVFAIPFKLIGLRFVELLKVLRISFLNSLLLFVVLLGFRKILPSAMPDIIVLLLSFIVGATVYGLATWYTNQEQLKELWDLSGLGRKKQYEVE